MELTSIQATKDRIAETKTEKSTANLTSFQSPEEIALFLHPMVIALQTSLQK